VVVGCNMVESVAIGNVCMMHASTAPSPQAARLFITMLPPQVYAHPWPVLHTWSRVYAIVSGPQVAAQPDWKMYAC